MLTRQEINERIEAYAKAVRNRDAKAVSELFADKLDHIVHGIGSNPNTPWNTKQESDRAGIFAIYEEFFTSVDKIDVQYTDRCIDAESNSAAVVVRVKNTTTNMVNSLHIKWNDQGKIIFFYNWYGQGL